MPEVKYFASYNIVIIVSACDTVTCILNGVRGSMCSQLVISAPLFPNMWVTVVCTRPQDPVCCPPGP